MSNETDTDNGTYVLETKGPEFRVAHLIGIEQIYAGWDDEKNGWAPNIPFILEKFGGSKVYTDLETAWDAAQAIDSSYLVSSFGTNLIKDFQEIDYSDFLNGKGEEKAI